MVRHSPSGFTESAEFMVPSIMASHPGPGAAKQPTTITHVWLLVWRSFYEILCWFYARFNGTRTFQKVQLLSHQSTEHLLRILGIIFCNFFFFWQMRDEPLFSFWSAVAFALNVSHGCCFCPVSFLLLNHEHWP